MGDCSLQNLEMFLVMSAASSVNVFRFYFVFFFPVIITDYFYYPI